MVSLAKSTAIIELHVPDFNVVKAFYGDIGFRILWEYPAEGKNGYLMMKLEDNLIGFYCGNQNVYKHDYFGRFPKETKRGYGVEIGLFVKDSIEKYYDNINSLHPRNIVERLSIQPWGIRDFRIVDPFGFYIRMSEPSDMSKA